MLSSEIKRYWKKGNSGAARSGLLARIHNGAELTSHTEHWALGISPAMGLEDDPE